MGHFHLFAYGTLRDPGRPPGSDLLRDCERVGDASVRGTLYDAGSYPALVLDGTDTVPGIIWRCPADLLPRLDRYEGVDERLFRRVALRIGDLACWLFVAGPRLGERLAPDRRIRRIETRAEDPGRPYL